MELNKYKLGELLDVTRGASLAGEYYATEGEYIRLTCGNFDYNNNCFKENTTKDNLYYNGPIKTGFIMKKGDIITPLTEQAIGLLGSTAIIPESDKYIQSQDIAKISCNEKLLYPNYAFYLISSNIVKNQLSVAAQQTKIRHTSPDKIKDCTVWIPDLTTQRKIASILSTIDRKIALNRSINRNLEALAKQLYDYWFVQFDFPNEDGRPYKSSGGKMVWNEDLKREIPEGWEVTKLKDLAETEKDQINPQSFPDIHFKHYSLPEFDKTGTYGVELGSEIQSNKFVISENSVMVSKLNPWTNRVICGNDEDNQIGSTEFVVLNPKNVQYKPFIFQLVKSEKFITYCTKGSTGTSHSHRRISPDLLVSFRFAYKKNVVEQYSKTLSKYISLLQENTKNTQMLTKQRDELLPLLMNGQVSVK